VESAALKSVEVGDLINSRPLTGLQIRTIVLCGLVVLLDGFDIQTMALVVPTLVGQWGIPREQFSWALSAALVGLGCGSALIAPFGDRVGRRPMIIAFVTLVGIGSLGTTLATSPWEFVVWRFVTGLGLGTSITNSLALTSEFMPLRKQAFLTSVMFCNIAIGAFISGNVAPPLIEACGWQGVFIAGGVFPLLLVVLLALGSVESVRFLLAGRPGDPRIGAILARIAPQIDARAVYAAPRDRVANRWPTELLSPTYRPRTIVLWSVFALNLFVMYSLVSWLPQLLTESGWTIAQAQRGSVLVQVGSVVGGLLMTVFVDRGKTAATLLIAYTTATVGLALFMIVPPTLLAWSLIIIVVGAGINGTQLALYALSAAFYPAAIRATGIGWAITASRAGAVGGPLALGAIMTLDPGTPGVLGTLIVPTVACAACVLLMPRVLKQIPIGPAISKTK
jgi:AAHS family 4-hydroxybenzoate transporter-like MFS transporter